MKLNNDKTMNDGVPSVPLTGVEGNTSTTPLVSSINPAKHWLLVWNNYPDDWLEILDVPEVSHYLFGREIGQSGTPHIQGYVWFAKKERPFTIYKNRRDIHWEVARGTLKQNLIYTMKEKNYVSKGFKVPKCPKTIVPDYEWEIELLKKLKEEPDDRTLFWYWSYRGKTGKSQFAKYLCLRHQALIVYGAGRDCMQGVVGFFESTGSYPEIIVVDLPRNYNIHRFNYTIIEQLKNGLFFSPKYEGAMCIFDSPHIVIFSNDEPETDGIKMSVDKWDIVNID